MTKPIYFILGFMAAAGLTAWKTSSMPPGTVLFGCGSQIIDTDFTNVHIYVRGGCPATFRNNAYEKSPIDLGEFSELAYLCNQMHRSNCDAIPKSN